MYNSKISGLGFYLPDNIVTNNDLEKIMDTTDNWIKERTGIEERRWVKSDSEDTTSVMGVKAAKLAISDANLKNKDIDFIIFATLSPDYFFPGSGVMVQDMMDMSTIGSLDVRNQCSGFIYALSIADQYIKTGMYKNILVIGSETHSPGLDKTTRGRGVSVIFGDGAGAAVVSRELDKSKGILSTHLHSQGKYAKELSVISPGMGTRWVSDILKDNDPDDESYLPYMNGQFVFKNAIVRFSEVINEALKKNNLTKNDIKLLIPHQANLRISQFVQRSFKLQNNQIFNNISKYGNTTAASIPIALAEAYQANLINKGDIIILAAFGSGFTWGSALIKW
ncbi:ketoacyl-ACP synthase III [Flavobacteriales bacterium]|nr:ketoacyl-ACP synthase III [Flavobacteriales bacterium]